MSAAVKREPLDGLGNHIYLEKQDRLREIGVDIPTSQVNTSLLPQPFPPPKNPN